MTISDSFNQKKSNSNRATGNLGEDKAAAYLQAKKCRILARNYRSRYGEIDIIVRHEGTICFVEVKTRRQSSFGEGSAAVNHFKQKHLLKSAIDFLCANGWEDQKVRFDVLSISEDISKKIVFNWIQDAFRADGA